MSLNLFANQKIKEKTPLVTLVSSTIIVIVLVTVLFTYDFKPKVSGKVVEEVETSATTFEISCKDSDAKNYGTKGEVRYCNEGNCLTEKDNCSGNMLIELYCENNEKKSEEKECESGCDGGACLSAVAEYETKTFGTGGGGGGGSGTSSPKPTTMPAGENYNLEELISENTLNLAKFDNIQFELEGQTYNLLIKENTATQVDIDTGLETISLTVREDNNLDLNQGSSEDIYIKVTSINAVTGRITLKLRPLF